MRPEREQPTSPTETPQASHRPGRRLAEVLRDRPQGQRLRRALPECPRPERTDPARGWRELGPFGVAGGEAVGRPVVSGRMTGLAILPQGESLPRIYAASAYGGVWRSLDGGKTWEPRMDHFDVDPQALGSASLSCGALWAEQGESEEEDLLFVGTGSGFDAYLGVGIVRSDTGGCGAEGGLWEQEASEPSLEGYGCYQFAAPPDAEAPEFAATTRGLYRRDAARQRWSRVLEGNFTSVVFSSSDEPRYFAAEQGARIWVSPDGDSWDLLEETFFGLSRDRRLDAPGRVALAAAQGFVFALVADAVDLGPVGLFRQAPGEKRWRPVAGLPRDLLGETGAFQGNFDLALAVDPLDPSVLYLGGASVQVAGEEGFEFSAGLFRGDLREGPSGPVLTPTYLGAQVHPDVHVIVPDPETSANSKPLWVGSDGGAFFLPETSRPDDGAVSLNEGFSTFLVHHVAQDPDDTEFLLAATQDNGCLLLDQDRSSWSFLKPGDGGRVVVHWREPGRALRTVTGADVRGSHDLRSTEVKLRDHFNSGASYRFPPSDVPWPAFDASPFRSRRWTATDAAFTRFYAPMAACPDPWTAGVDESELDPDLVAFGSCRPWISEDFGRSWQPLTSGNVDLDHLGGSVTALAFADRRTLYAGTDEGRVFRFDRSGRGWVPRRLEMPEAGRQGVTSLCPRPDVPGAVFATFGGDGPAPPVWYFDGFAWEARSGQPGGDKHLLPVHHSWIVRHPESSRLYVAADIGVWTSPDEGRSWVPLATGLPEAPVLHLLLHPQGLLRAATYGRGLFEIDV